MKNNHGFTLIELLIVVAIIAILAAIAIPNFLAAQVRSKVSKAKAEFRTIATAVESYDVDNNTYPVYNNGNGQSGVFGDDGYNSNMMHILTTPISYITSWPRDQFAINNANPTIGVGYFMYTWNGSNAAVGGPFNTFLFADHWALRSRGPDSDWTLGGGTLPPYTSEATYGDDRGTLLRTYAPTNGTVSNGDIWRTSLSGQL